MKINCPFGQRHFYGSAQLGEKGQVVIPNEARKNMRLKKGDRLLVLGIGDDSVVLMKFSEAEKIAKLMSKEISSFFKKEK